jgi:hypothetical protein
MPNPLKPKIKQTLVFTMNSEQLLAVIKQQFGASWQIESRAINSDTIVFHAVREGVEISGRLERWQGTESRLHLDGEVLSKVPYENWREWTGVGTFAALIALWFTLAFLPFTETAFLNLYLIMTSTATSLSLFMLLSLTIFLGLPFLAQRYFSQLSPDIRLYEEAQSHLANFVSELKTLQTLPDLDISRLEQQEEALPISEVLHENSKALLSKKG